MNNTNLTTSLFVTIAFLVLLLLPFELLLEVFDLDDFKVRYLGDSLKNVVIIVLGYLLIKKNGYLRIAGLTNLLPKYPVLVLIPLYFVLIGPIQYIAQGYQFQNIEASNILILFCSMLTVGISEEIVFRGFILPHLIKGAPHDQPLILPVIYASLLFGVLHFLNLLQPDSYVPLVLSQVIYATMFGVAFGIILLRSGSIYPLMLLHGIINFSSNWDDLPGAIVPATVEMYRIHEAVLSVIIVLPFLLLALRQISKVDRTSVMRLYNSTDSN